MKIVVYLDSLSKRLVKLNNRLLSDDNTFYVWYWDDPTKDLFEASVEQDKIREKYYTLDRKTPTYIVAREELKSGIEIPKHKEV